MLRKLFTIFTVLFCFLLQSSVFPWLSMGGIVPNLFIIITASFGFMREENTGILVGFFSGFLCDVFFGNVLGFYALIYMLIGFVNGKFARIFYPQDIKLPLSLITLSDITYSFVCYILLYLLKGRFDIGWYTLHVMIPELIYTIILTLFLYPVILFVSEKLEGVERKREQKFV